MTFQNKINKNQKKIVKKVLSLQFLLKNNKLFSLNDVQN